MIELRELTAEMVEDARQIWVTTRDGDGKIVWDSRRLPPFSGPGKPAAIMPENLEILNPSLSSEHVDAVLARLRELVPDAERRIIQQY